MLNYYGLPAFYEETYVSPYDIRRQQLLRQQRALEMARRQAEQERMQRIRQEQAMIERQRQIQMLKKRRQLEEEERRRRLIAERKEAQRRLRLAQEIETERTRPRVGLHPSSTVVRGADGRLYRLGTRNDMDISQGSNSGDKMSSMECPIEERTGKCSKQPSSNCTEPSEVAQKHSNCVGEKTDMDVESISSTCQNISANDRLVENLSENKSLENEATKNTSPRSHALVVGVEDASDDEDDDLKSIWRNRRPTAGNWIEPVEGY